MLSLSSGHSADYLTGAVAAGRENYYTGAVAAGEPPGRWSGRGAERLGLSGEVDTQDMTALYERFIDPSDEAFRDPVRWDEAVRDGRTLGHTGRRYLSEDEIYEAALDAEPGADAERRAALRVEAGKKARKNVAFLDATFNVQKSITVLHTAFEAQEVRARSAAEQARTALAQASTSAAGVEDSTAGAASAGGAVHRTARRAVETVRRAGASAAEVAAELAAAEAEASAWAEYRRAVEDAIWAGNQAALEYLADKAGYSRVGHHGGAAGRWTDAHDWTVASFFQHDSRNHDPQLHIHNAILNRVEGADGTWRTLDSKAVHKYRGAASEVGDRVMEQHLTRSLGVRFAMRPDGKAREVVGIDQGVMDLFSSRRHAITRKTQELVTTFETTFGRNPTSLELHRLQQQATLATRRAKSHDGETVEQRLTRWDTELRAEVQGGLRQVADTILSQAADQPSRPRRGAGNTAARFTPHEVIETALADLQDKQSAWTVPDLTRAISMALPDQLGNLTADQTARLLDGLTEQALQLAVPLHAERPGTDLVPAELRKADGTSAYEAPGALLYATPAHLHTERLLSAAAVERGAPTLPPSAVTDYLTGLAAAGVRLGEDQAAAVRGILTSGAKVESLIGPAGTGKSFVVGTLAKAWQDPDLWTGHKRRVVGLAASQIATEVLAGEGLAARNIARWLATQDRLADDRPFGDDKAWRLRAGDLVVVDESAMANTAALARIHAVCQETEAKLLLVGDHRQLAAVGAAGGMELAATHGMRHELAETRRFSNDWEGPASLRLRDGDQTVLADYHKHGRLVDGGAIEQTEQAAARAWLADTLAGRHALLIVDTNEQAARLSAHLRTELVRLGVVDEHAVPLGLQGTFAGRGDLVQARRNAWELAAPGQRAPINREQYRVLDTLNDGGLIVAPVTGRASGREILGETMTLPGSYVAEHVALGYASTVHAAQGLTVDTCHTVATSSTGVEALYVGMTRGRHSNTAHVVTRAVPTDAAPGQVLDAVHRSPQAVLAGAFDTADPQLSALAEATASAAQAESVRTPAELFADAAELATAGRTARWLDQMVADGTLTEHQRVAIAAEDGAATLTTLLRRVELAGHDPHQILTDAIGRRSLDDARQLTNVIHRRITETTSLDPIGDSYAAWVPSVDDPQWHAYLTSLAHAADQRRAELGRQIAGEAPQWAVEALGPVPADDGARREWEEGAATAAAHRELVGHDDPADALGPAPKPGLTEAYASWRAAWRALGRPEADRAEAEMSTGQLRVRIRAYDREKAWAPPYVANELAGTRQAADKHRQDAAVRRAEADAASSAGDDATWAQRQREAADAAALAAALDARAAELEHADEARAHWYAHTAETRTAADRAAAELSTREAAVVAADEAAAVTADEWLAAHAAAVRAEDPHREITTEHDLADITEARDSDHRLAMTREAADAAGAHGEDANEKAAAPPAHDRAAEHRHHATEATRRAKSHDGEQSTEAPSGTGASSDPRTPEVQPAQREIADREPEPAPRDIRQEAADEPGRDDGHDPDNVRVPSADETAESVRRAQRALAELRYRQAVEEQRAADQARERDDEIARWHTDAPDRTPVDGAYDEPHERSADRSADSAADRDAGQSGQRDDAAVDAGPVLEVTPSDDY